MNVPTRQPRRKILTLILTEDCNLRCTYCYEEKSRNSRLSISHAKNAIAEAFADDEFDEVEIDFFGGEPLLEFETIVEICDWLWSKDRPKPYICFAITNGTLVHGKIADWARQNNERFIMGLSLDGTPEMHNTNRGKSYNRIDIDLFRELWPEQSVKMTVSRETMPHLAEGIIHIHSLGLIPLCTYAFGVEWTPAEVDIFSEQLGRLADFYIDRPNLIPCNIIAMPIEFAGYNGEVRNYCGAGTGITCIDTSGEKYPCQTFVPMSSNRNHMDTKGIFEALRTGDMSKDTKCRTCVIRHMCQTCYGINRSLTGDMFTRSSENCQFSKVRALASANLIGRMLTGETDNYRMLKGKAPEDLAAMAQGVILVNSLTP